MQLDTHDPRITAYLLGELPAVEAAAVERAIAADPALQVAAEDLAEFMRDLGGRVSTGPAALYPAQRDAVMRALRSESPAPATPAARPAPARRGHPWFMPFAAAATLALAAGVIILNRPPATPPPTATHPSPHPTPPAAHPNPPPAKPNHPPDNSVAILPGRAFLNTATTPVLDLPVQAGTQAIHHVRDAVLKHGRLPDPAAVRSEEILNYFNLRPNGQTVVARHPPHFWHPDDRSFGSTSHAATLAIESIACPWQPSSVLVLISFRGNPYSDCTVQARFHPADDVLRYKLLGFACRDGQTPRPPPTLLPAKAATLLAMEIQPATAAGNLGSIEWAVNGEPAASLTLNRPLAGDPSNDARFAALVCSFAQWLAAETSGMLDREVLAALAREADAPDLPPARRGLLELVDQSLRLAPAGR